MDACATDRVLLGTGGPSPGLWASDETGRGLVEVLRLEHGHSVYAADMDQEAGWLAAGTRGGRLHVLPIGTEPDSEATCDARVLVQGAAVLSVCLLGASHLAATDTAGRCLLWSPDAEPMRPRVMPCAGAGVCSLSRIGDDRLAGLSQDGQLLIWHWSDAQLIHEAQLPAPPDKGALVHLVSWQDPERLAYPTIDGHLATYDLRTHDLATWPAHREGFSVAMASGEELLTVGRHDGQLKFWHSGEQTPVRSIPAPTDIIAGAVLTDHPLQMVLITAQGAAGLYGLGQGGLQLLRTVEGGAYRTAIGQRFNVRAAHQEQHRIAEAKSIQQMIQDGVDRNEVDDLDGRHARLVALGFEEVSLALRARQAAKQEDLAAELSARCRLAGLLPDDDQRAVRSLERYAGLLLKTWQLGEAHRVHVRLASLGHEPTEFDRVAEQAEALQSDDWAIAADVPIPVMIEAATAIGECFAGRWQAQRFKPVSFEEGDLRARTLAAAYEQLRTAQNRQDLPAARATALQWIGRESVETLDVVHFEARAAEPSPQLQLILQLVRNATQSVVVPVALFGVPRPVNGMPIAGHNRRAKEAWAQLSGSPLTNSGFRTIARLISLALRRLHTQALARREAQKGLTA